MVAFFLYHSKGQAVKRGNNATNCRINVRAVTDPINPQVKQDYVLTLVEFDFLLSLINAAYLGQIQNFS